MNKKGSKYSTKRPSRPTKRRFNGNQHTVEEEISFTSASAAKLKKSGDEEVIIDNNYGYCILEFFSVFTTLSLLVICSTCKQNMKFSRTAARGLGFKIALQCECEDIRYIPSSPLIDKAFEVNRRLVAAMRLLGVGREGINKFCSMMDICQGLTIGRYYSCLENLYSAASAVYDLIISKAVEEEKELISTSDPNANLAHFTVSGDGTWKKRGFNSLFGVTTLVAKYSKKVVDTVVKTSFCQDCDLWKHKKQSDTKAYEDWYEEHQDSCTINHKRSAGKMEVDAVVEMFRRSEAKHEVKYVRYIGDGDSKTFEGILDINPYDGDPIVEKKECVGHVEKRMGSQLRKAKKDNEGIGGRVIGELTDKFIDELTLYYGLAIRRNPDSVENMQKDIWATYYHKSSTDMNPLHMNCPPGPSSWCKWQKAVAEGTIDKFVHENPLSNDVLKVIKPIYESLSTNTLLERCLGSENQNNNESLNSLIWTFAPKYIHAETQTIEIATFLAVTIFNEGFIPILKMLNVMGVKIGPEAHAFAIKCDETRIECSEIRASVASKKARTSRLHERTSENEYFKVEEGPLYETGITD